MSELKRILTGIIGLDVILCGGLVEQRSYLVRGKAGTGKTTLGLHYLTADDTQSKKNLFITFGESAEQVKNNAQAISIDTNLIDFLDLSPSSTFFSNLETYDIFSSAEVEREPITKTITAKLDELQPERVFIDAMTQLHYLSNDAYDFRRYILSFLRYLMEHDISIMFTSEESDSLADEDLQFIADGVIHLRQELHRRSIRVVKSRGSDFIGDYHTMRLTDDGMIVYPRLIEPEMSERDFNDKPVASGIAELDEMLHGGLERGTVSLITGPTGIGKTTFGLQFMKEAAGRGERSVIYTFEEDDLTIKRRCEGISIPVEEMLESGMLRIVQIEPLQLTPDEFAHMVRHEVEDNDAKIVMIDSISGYKLSVQGDDLIKQLHIQTKYLRMKGVTVILINEVHRLADPIRATEIEVSYLMDSIIYMRYIEVKGSLHRAVGVLKKRVSDFEKTMREFEFTQYGIRVSKPLTGLRGLLTGNPIWGEIETEQDKPNSKE
ncbi:MAG: ATPase domain-containing protein [Chloroflexota bacterium]